MVRSERTALHSPTPLCGMRRGRSLSQAHLEEGAARPADVAAAGRGRWRCWGGTAAPREGGDGTGMASSRPRRRRVVVRRAFSMVCTTDESVVWSAAFCVLVSFSTFFSHVENRKPKRELPSPSGVVADHSRACADAH